MEKIKKLFNIKWTLVLYDAILYFATFFLMFLLNKGMRDFSAKYIIKFGVTAEFNVT